MLEHVNVHIDYCFKGLVIGTINNFGIKIQTPKNLYLEQNSEVKIYLKPILTAGIKNNFVLDFYGFVDYRERNLFKDLIEINGIGPKTALAIVEFGIENLIKCVEMDDFDEIKKLVKLNQKQITSIITFLTYKYDIEPKKERCEQECLINNELSKQTSATLLALGYSKSNIDLVMKKIDFQAFADVSECVNRAIKLMN